MQETELGVPVRYDEMDENRTTMRVIKRMTDPEQIEIRRQHKEEVEMNAAQVKRIGL